MRKEANLEQWRELYDVTLRIQSLQPWKFLWDMNLITLQLPEFEQLFFASVMGRNGECFAVAVMEGADALNNFYQLAVSPDIPSSQSIRYQNNLTCYFGGREELSKSERDTIKKLGLKFCGKNQWIYFRSYERGYAPFLLDETQVVKLTRVFQELFMALKAFIENQIPVDFDKQQTLYRRFDPERELWITTAASLNIPRKKYRIPVVNDEVLIGRLKKQKSSKAVLEIDTLFLNAVIHDSESGRPIMPVLFLLAERHSGLPVDQEILSPGDDDITRILSSIIKYIEDFGRPEKIVVRDEEMAHLLSDLCQRVDIKIGIEGSLQAIDALAEEFERFSFF
ncbi:MAG TPA: hypothetical protein VN370_03625 [Desulfitobacteriaceae bacterium]|nr:hypothetical protein [Desulfitobacteriaceae bacterium]